MIKTENFEVNGRDFVRTWSDKSVLVERNGVQYEIAEDPAEFGRTYTETGIPIGSEESAEEIVDILTGKE